MTKKKTTKTKNTKRSAQWNDYFKAAITGFSSNAEMTTLAGGHEVDDTVVDAEMIHDAASIVKRAEKIADIATARNT